MQALIQTIADKANISSEQARIALDTTLDIFKTKLPDSIGDQLNGLLNGQEFSFTGVLSDQLTDLKSQAAEKLEDIREGAAETLEDLQEGAVKKWDDLRDGLKKML